MKANLTVEIELSRKLDKKAELELKKFFDDANKNLLNLGENKRIGNIDKWNLKGSGLILSVSSSGEGRAHNVLPRIHSRLAQLLGKNFKVGIKEIKSKNLKLEFTVTKEPIAKINLPFATINFKGKTATMTLEEVDSDFLEKGNVDRMVSLVEEKISKQEYAGKAENHELLFESKKKKPIWEADPTEEMVKLGWVKQGPTKGKWFYGPQAAAIMKTMEKIAVEEVLKPLGFQEVVESHIVPFSIWKKTGHLKGMPNEIYYVCEPATRDESAWETFIDKLKITGEVDENELRKVLKAPTAGICYAQCPVIYWSMEDKIIDEKSLPLLVFDKTANSCRYESGGRHGIERVDEFHRIEPVFIGTPEQIVKIKEKLFARYKYVFDKILEIEWRTAWVTPFYMAQAGMDGLDEGKVKGTVDFEAWLPYRGSREESEWLEFQNLSIVGDKYTKAFNIKGQKNVLWSGCSGVGLERWTATFLSQKGLDPKNWPKKFRKYLGKLPEGIKTL